MKNFLFTLFICLLAFTSSIAFGSNFGFLYDTPIRHLTDADWKMIEKTSDTALDRYPNNKKAQWSNPESGNSGFVEPLDKTKKAGTTCRNLKIFYKTKFGDSESTFLFCHYADGWKSP